MVATGRMTNHEYVPLVFGCSVVGPAVTIGGSEESGRRTETIDRTAQASDLFIPEP